MNQCTQCGQPTPAGAPCATCGAFQNSGPSFEPPAQTVAGYSPQPAAYHYPATPPPQQGYQAATPPQQGYQAATPPQQGYQAVPGYPVPPAYPAGVVAPTAKKSGGWKVLLVAALVLVLGVGGFVGMRVFSNRSDSAAGQNKVPKLVKHIELTAAPLYVAAAPNGNVYVSHFDGQPLSVIVNGKVISRLMVGSSAGGLAVAPDNTVYASDYKDQTLVGFKNHKRMGPGPIGQGPNQLAVDRKGVAYVVLEESAAVMVVNQFRTQTTIKVGGNLGAIMVAPDGRVFVADYKKNVVSVIKDGKVAQTIKVSDSPGFMGMTSDGTLYVAMQNCDLAVIKNAVVTATIPLGACDEYPMVAVGPDDRVFATLSPDEGDGELVVVTGSSVTGRVKVGSTPYGVSVGADGTVYVAESGEDRIAVLR